MKEYVQPEIYIDHLSLTTSMMDVSNIGEGTGGGGFDVKSTADDTETPDDWGDLW